MKHPIGFVSEEENNGIEHTPVTPRPPSPKKSLVQVYFPERNQTLTYFNDQFDLKQGDFVFVEGKLEKERGIVRQVLKSFKIKVADYKKVIGLADTNVTGQLYIAGSHFVSFEPNVLPYEKMRTWYLPPEKEEDEYAAGYDDTSFMLEKLSDMKVSPVIFERGREYYIEDRVVYMEVDETYGRAIVEGEHPYEVEFDFYNGEICNLTCSCPCGYTCKHEVAAMLQLKDTLEKIEKNHAHLHDGYFAAIEKSALFRFAVQFRQTGSITL